MPQSKKTRARIRKLKKQKWASQVHSWATTVANMGPIHLANHSLIDCLTWLTHGKYTVEELNQYTQMFGRGQA